MWEQHSYQWNTSSWGARKFTETFDCNSFQTSNRWLGGWKERYILITSLYVLHLKIHSKVSGLHSEKYNQWLISTSQLIKYHVSVFSQPLSFSWKIRSKNLRSYNLKTHIIQTNVIVPWVFELHEFYEYIINWI